MNARRKKRFRECQRQRAVFYAERELRRANRGEPKIVECNRCGAPMLQKWLDTLAQWSRCCGKCQMRNFFDGFDLPTPPDLLDRFTVHPTLTEKEWREKL